jgi:hypothetical protein
LKDPDDEEYDEAESFYEFLTDGELPEGADIDDLIRYCSLARGVFKFLFQLTEFLGPLGRREDFYFAAFFSYYLSKFYGYDLRQRGYVKSDDGWADIGGATAFQRLISNALIASPSPNVFEGNAKMREVCRLYAASVKDAVSFLENVWKRTSKRLTVSRRAEQRQRISLSKRHRAITETETAPPTKPATKCLKVSHHQ